MLGEPWCFVFIKESVHFTWIFKFICAEWFVVLVFLLLLSLGSVVKKKKKKPFNSWYWKIVSSYFSPFFFSVVKGLPILLIFPKSQPTLRFIEFLYHFSLLNVIAFTCILTVAFLFLALCLFHSSYFRFFRWKLGLLIWDCTLLTYLFGARKVLVSPTSPGPYKCSHTDALQFTRELHPVKPIRSQNYCKVKTHLIHVTYQTS